MQNSNSYLHSFFTDLDTLDNMIHALSYRLENSDDESIDHLVDRCEFFVLKLKTALEKHHSDAESKINELQQILYVPDFNYPDIDFSYHFFEVGQQYRNFLRNLKYEGRINKVSTLPTALPIVNIESNPVQQKNESPKKVFIVHGHDDALKTEVARFIERQELEAIILHEQIDTGETIIEKIEKHSKVGFAIILYTPCDLGRSSREPEESNQPRARQNVVFEHGYFMAKLGRSKVLALKKEEVEIPNDLSGTIHTAYDSPGAWKLQLARVLETAGYKINYAAIN